MLKPVSRACAAFERRKICSKTAAAGSLQSTGVEPTHSPKPHHAERHARLTASPHSQQRCVLCPSSSSSAAASNGAGVSHAASAPAIPGLRIRQGGPADLSLIWSAIWQEKMNPLGIDPHRFLLATIPAAVHPEGGPLHKPPARAEQVAGIGQLKPMPTSKGYAAGAKDYELASLVVQKEYRGKGVGTSLVQSLQQRVAIGDRITLVTLARRTPFYERFGFTILREDQIPDYLSFELVAGAVVAKLVANQSLVAMAWTRTA